MNVTFDPFHMHAGLAVFFVTLAVLRKTGSTLIPLLAVIVMEVVLLWPGLTGPEAEGRVALNGFLSAIIWPFVITVLGQLGLLEALVTPRERPRR
ncbi:hypothetical protein [Devosia rhizoryzae]|uniref:Uncharacterized protein n=1 Tax=Devosia rhizoryzae TaxID=2774137 RepID=A0ABX7CA57_9HYPH|nr:hypothetical protein [Devosia rhizoryzae]QQR40089.1 hypothetical protein JI748_03490 [Devosia rhizoryzae]